MQRVETDYDAQLRNRRRLVLAVCGDCHRAVNVDTNREEVREYIETSPER
jgi:hypothetical protein